VKALLAWALSSRAAATSASETGTESRDFASSWGEGAEEGGVDAEVGDDGTEEVSLISLRYIEICKFGGYY